jgi:hypothetical protein
MGFPFRLVIVKVIDNFRVAVGEAKCEAPIAVYLEGVNKIGVGLEDVKIPAWLIHAFRGFRDIEIGEQHVQLIGVGRLNAILRAGLNVSRPLCLNDRIMVLSYCQKQS